MKNVELDSRGRVVRHVPVWLLPGALACIGVGVLLPLRVPKIQESVHVQPESASTDQSGEIEQLKQAVNLLEHKSAALAVAVSSPGRDVDQRPGDDEVAKAPAEVEDTRSAAEIHQEEITTLEVRLETEKDGSRESLLAARTMHAELGAAPLDGARIREVECSTSLCRATLEQDLSAKPMDMSALIEATPTVRGESMFNYEEEGSVKRVTIYSARAGHRLNSSEPNSAPGSPTH